jgi:hypothetical protein
MLNFRQWSGLFNMTDGNFNNLKENWVKTFPMAINKARIDF